jgi:acyl-CoA thioester hydrolase
LHRAILLSDALSEYHYIEIQVTSFNAESIGYTHRILFHGDNTMTVFSFHSEPLQDSWLDLYGHLNEAYYLVPFSNTSWIMQDHFGIGSDYFDATGCAIYTVETHLRYLNDVHAPAVMDIETLMLGSDAKKIWFAHRMLVDGELCATAEFMALHYNTRETRTMEMPAAVQAALKAAEVEELPDWVGRQISLLKQ